MFKGLLKSITIIFILNQDKYSAENHKTILLDQKQSTYLKKCSKNNLAIVKFKEITELHNFNLFIKK